MATTVPRPQTTVPPPPETAASVSPQDVALLYAAVELQLSEVVQQALASGQLDTVRGRRRYQLAVRSLLTHARPDAKARVRAMLETAYGDGARAAGARAPGAIQRATIDQLARALMVRLDGSLDTVGRQTDDIFRRVGLQQAARQLGPGELPREAAVDLMRKDLADRGLTGFIDKAHRRWTLSNYSRMALRTVASEASNRGVLEAMSAVGRDLVRVSDNHCRFHKNDPENPCRALEGKVLSAFGETPGVPVLPSPPPWHPNCEHHLAPAPEATG
jgi:hypothetical protein